MFPYLDLAGFSARTLVPASDVALVEATAPGFTAQRIAVWSSWINSRLRKRYGASLPLGQSPPALLAAGTLPPSVVLTGRPTIGSVQVRLEVTTGGALGAALFRYSLDAGQTFVTGVATGASVALGASGMQAAFPAGSYATDNVYAAASPVPETVLGWLVVFVQLDVMRKRGVNPSDPMVDLWVKDLERVSAEIKEAADSKDGLFDLPSTEDADTAITTGGPLAASDTSPYIWQDRQRTEGTFEDRASRQSGGTFNP